ncbi:MAG TPA: hypothetical protein VGG85_09840 [Terracidiphilus sp.]
MGRSTTRIVCTVAGVLATSWSGTYLKAEQAEPANQLVRDVVYNELRDHQTHGFWRYWIQQLANRDTKLEEEVETADGPVTRVVRSNNMPLDPHRQREEQAKLEKLASSPEELASHRQAYEEDEKHISLVMAMLPDAYVFEYAGEENGCHHLRYRPNPSYAPRTIEARVLHAMTGDLWINAHSKRMARLDGRLDDNVDFGFGLLGRLEKGGWFRMQRIQVSTTEWKTERLDVHLSGRAVLFKSICRETSELRGGFVSVPAGISLAEGIRILDQTDPKSPPVATASVTPVSFNKRR